MLPEPVVTTAPAVAPFLTGDVVISVPSRKPFALLTFPVIDPFGFCFQRESTGIPADELLALVEAAEFPPLLNKLKARFAAGASFLAPRLMVPTRFGT